MLLRLRNDHRKRFLPNREIFGNVVTKYGQRNFVRRENDAKLRRESKPPILLARSETSKLVRPLTDKSLLSIKDATYFQLLHGLQTACAEAKTTDNETE
jgi:hypothetical protein